MNTRHQNTIMKILLRNLAQMINNCSIEPILIYCSNNQINHYKISTLRLFFDAWRKIHSCLRPYGEITGSHLICKVKHRRAWVVLGWVTTWEVRVLQTFNFFLQLNVNNLTAWRKLHSCLRPYHGEITGSRLISKVKHRRAWVVLGWVTT